MAFLRFLQTLRSPALDAFFSAVTYLGDELAFMALALVMFWCVDKRGGYFVFLTGFLGTISNQFLKLLCRVPRPWVLDPTFSIVESAREAASGYSFPSGHSQSAVSTLGGIALFVKNKWVRAACLAGIVLVPFSRMYLGVHTPQDVVVGVLLSGAILLLLYPVFASQSTSERFMPCLQLICFLCAAGFLGYVLLADFPADIDAHNLASGTKSAYMLAGCVAGLCVVYPIDRNYIRFCTKAPWYGQLLKLVLGLALLLAVKSGLKAPLQALLPDGPADAVRYFLLVIFAGCVWPLSFPFFARLGHRKDSV